MEEDLTALFLDSSWWDAVQLGAHGKYRAAYRILSKISTNDLVKHGRHGEQSAPVFLQSLAISTIASHQRQMGRHSRARSLDAHALSLAYQCSYQYPLPHRLTPGNTPLALGDALTGLAADCIGISYYDHCQRYLDKVAEILRLEASLSDVGWGIIPRLTLRWHWVSTELALARNSKADNDSAREHSLLAVQLAHSFPEKRYLLKSQLIAIAAGQIPYDQVYQVRQDCIDHQLWPLAWAASLLAHDEDQAHKIMGRIDHVMI